MLIKVQSTFSKVQSPITTLTESVSFDDFVYLNNNE